MAFAVGLLPFRCSTCRCAAGTHWRTRRPRSTRTVVYNVLMVGVSLPLFYWAAVEFKVTALALGYSVAYWFTFGLAWMVLNRRLGHLQARQTAWCSAAADRRGSGRRRRFRRQSGFHRFRVEFAG